MKDNRNNKKKNLKKGMSPDDFFAEERFDEEDEDSVTDDTLEFLCLDDETIESYKSERKSTGKAVKTSASRYKDDYEDEDYEDYEDEDYEDEDYEDEDYEDEDYEDEDYEDEEDEEYDDYDDERGGVIVRFQRFLTEMSTLDMVVAMLGIVVIAGVIFTSTLFANAKSVEKQVAAFASVGEEMEGISVIGEGGLLAVSESARIGSMIEIEEPSEIVDVEEDQNKLIEVTLNLTSIQSDLKIKFVNKATGKLIGGVPFEVEVSNGKKTFDLRDDDKDGIIYQTGIEAGTYQVTAKPFKDNAYEEYLLPTSSTSVKVTDTIAYKKVDVSDEVKTEAEVNAAVEDTAKQDTEEESALQDTVEWVESTKTPINSDASYEEINKGNIPDPATIAALSTGYMKMVNNGAQDDAVTIGSIMPLGTEAPGVCTCKSQCTDGGINPDCTVCQGEGWKTNCKPQTQQPGESVPTDAEKIGTLGISQTSLALKKGESAALQITGDYAGSAKVEWSSDNAGVASVAGGTVTANGEGTATIRATATINSETRNDLVCTVTVSVEQTGPTDQEMMKTLSLNKTTLSLTPGGTDTLSISGTNVSAISSVSWTSGNTQVATVDGGGKVTAVGVGTTDIAALVKIGTLENTFKCTVTVSAQTYKIAKIEGDSKIKVNGTGTVKVTTDPAGGKISWSSDNDKIAKIENSNDTSATVKGIAAGTATITAKCGDATATWKVTVEKDLAGDNKTKLKDKNGNQIYVKKNGAFVEATYADYYTADKFYLQKMKYLYTGWQTIDGSVYFFDKNGNYVTGEQIIQGARYTFGSDGKLSSGSGTMGIDVSKHNGNIDWNAVKNSGVSFVIIRCGYRGSSTGVLVEDPKFRSNIKGAKAAGLKVGVYFFCQAVNEVEAVEEASMAISLVSGYGLDMPIFLDVESAGGRADGISRDTRTAVCRAFCQTVQNSGYTAGIYANKTWLNEKINTSSLTSYKIWLAQYASAPTYTTTRYDMWQYSSKGRISGISGDVDLDIRYY